MSIEMITNNAMSCLQKTIQYQYLFGSSGAENNEDLKVKKRILLQLELRSEIEKKKHYLPEGSVDFSQFFFAVYLTCFAAV